MAGSTATNQAADITNGLFNQINGRLIFASYSHESWTGFRSTGDRSRSGIALERHGGGVMEPIAGVAIGRASERRREKFKELQPARLVISRPVVWRER